MRLHDAGPVREVLNDIDFPADKQQIVDHARRKGADRATEKALSALPLGEYENIGEVVRSVEVEPAPERTETERVEQRRQHKPRLAEHMRQAEKKPLDQELD